MIVHRLERLASGVIDLADAKLLARVDADDEDTILERMCITAVMEFEDRAQIAIRNQAVRVTLPEWPRSAALLLPIGPLVDPEAMTVTAGEVDFDGFTIQAGNRARLRLTAARPAGPVQVEYFAGFDDEVPDDIHHALLDQVATYYDARGATDGKLLPVSPHFARIAARYRGVRA